MSKAVKGTQLSTFLGENFLDALRHTLSVVLPVWLLLDTGRDVYLPFGLGILLIGLTDLPGTVRDKVRTAVWSLATLTLTALTLALALPHWWAMQVFWIVAALALCLMGAGGNRLGLIGTMCLILAIFIYGLSPEDPVTFTFWAFLGAGWYHAIGIIQVLIFPFRSLRQAVFECLEASAALLEAKSLCYDRNIPLSAAYSQTVEAQRRLALKQEQVRHLLLSDPRIHRSSEGRGGYWLRTGLAVMELFEQINAIQFDYDHLRTALSTETLDKLSGTISRLSQTTRKLAVSFLFRMPQRDKRLPVTLDEIAADLGALTAARTGTEDERHTLNEILVNATAIVGLLNRLQGRAEVRELPDLDVLAFLPQNRFRWQGLRTTVKNYRSQWRFALRIAVIFGLLWTPISVLHFGNFGYWILLTVIVVSRPNFGLSWQRNLQRLWGTLAGLGLGVLAWFVFAGTLWTWALAAIFLFGFFWLQRLRYGYAVISISAAVVLLFAGERGISFDLVSERLLDTLIGCGAALVGAYLFPVWERRRLRLLIGVLVQKQREYLEEIARFASGATDLTRLRLARKQASATVAAYADGIAQAMAEPGHRRLDIPLLYELRETGYRINAVLVGLAIDAEQGLKEVPEQTFRNAAGALENTARIIGGTAKAIRFDVEAASGPAAAGWELLELLTIKLQQTVAYADEKYPVRRQA